MTAALLALLMVMGTVGGSLAQVAPPWRHQVAPLQTAEIIVGGVPLTVELAFQPADLSRGLGYRDGLEPGTGMLFLFEAPAPRSFWMKGMRFCLDMLWIEDGDRPSQKSPVPVSYVLEVPAGWMSANGVSIGDRVEELPVLVREPAATP